MKEICLLSHFFEAAAYSFIPVSLLQQMARFQQPNIIKPRLRPRNISVLTAITQAQIHAQSRSKAFQILLLLHIGLFFLLSLNILLLDHAIVLVRITKTFIKRHSLVRAVKDYFDASHHRFSHRRGVID